MTEREWVSLKHIMAKSFGAIMGYNIPVRDSLTAPAFTSEEPAIYLNKDSIYSKKAKAGEEKIYPLGLFYREMGKLYFSDYDYLAEKIKDFKGLEAAALLPIFHTIENALVNEKADEFIGGSPLKMLRTTTRKEYMLSPQINAVKHPFFIVLTAMLQYTEAGILKGDFSDAPDEKKIFTDIVPDIDEALDEPESSNRIDIYLRILEKMKPVWETCLTELNGYMNDSVITNKDFAEKTRKSLSSAMASGTLPLTMPGYGKGTGSGTGFDAEEEDDEDEETDRRTGRNRKTTFEELTSEEEEEKIKKMEEAMEESGSKKKKGSNSDDCKISYSTDDFDLSRPDEYEETAFENEVKDCVDALTELMKSELEMEKKEKAAVSPTEPIPDFPKIAAKYSKRNFSVKNRTVKASDPLDAINNYYAVCGKYKEETRTMEKRLKELFREDVEEREYRESGKISMKKVMSTTVSSKLCTKKAEPSGRSSIATMILIDESGSMCGTRIDRARAAAIALSEVFSQIQIPLYVMGFTADTEGADVVHRHYLQWNAKTIADRASLTSIRAYANNFDGYSIRTACEILDKRPEEHKVLIVISDGAPAASAYGRGLSGEADTTDAIRESRDKGISVVGVAIGSDKNMLYRMYKDDFVQIENLNDLFAGIMKKFTAMVKAW